MFYYEGKIVLTTGFEKKTQKTPLEEIRLALIRLILVNLRMEGGIRPLIYLRVG